MRFFVTGGAGFIGSALVRELIDTDHEVVIFDDFSRGKRSMVPTTPRITFIEGDIRDRTGVATAVRESRPELVIHLAALHFIPDCVARPNDTLEINVEGTRHVFDACASAEIRAMVFASSAAVYAPSDGPCSELASPLEPTDVYGESKLRGEQLANEYFSKTGCATSVLRIFNAIGPRETNPHVLPHVLETLQRTDALSLGNTSAKRDYIDTRDIARAISLIASRSRGLQVYNVGSGRAYSVSEIVTLLSAKLGRPLPITVDPQRLRASDRPLLLASVDKLERELGWSPGITLDAALDELIRHYGLRVGPVQA